MEDVISLRAITTQVQTKTLDGVAFEELYTTYLPKVYNYVAYRVGDERAAEDITAEVFERALTRLHTYRSNRGAFSTWIFRIAHNLVANYFRNRERHGEKVALDAMPTLAAGEVLPEQALVEKEKLQAVQACMRELPERQQEILALKFGSGLNNKEIAKTMRLKSNHVGVLLYRAVRSLRLALEKEGV